jgi:hypothetical protein
MRTITVLLAVASFAGLTACGGEETLTDDSSRKDFIAGCQEGLVDSGAAKEAKAESFCGCLADELTERGLTSEEQLTDSATQQGKDYRDSFTACRGKLDQ